MTYILVGMGDVTADQQAYAAMQQQSSIIIQALDARAESVMSSFGDDMKKTMMEVAAVQASMQIALAIIPVVGWIASGVLAATQAVMGAHFRAEAQQVMARAQDQAQLIETLYKMKIEESTAEAYRQETKPALDLAKSEIRKAVLAAITGNKPPAGAFPGPAPATPPVAPMRPEQVPSAAGPLPDPSQDPGIAATVRNPKGEWVVVPPETANQAAAVVQGVGVQGIYGLGALGNPMLAWMAQAGAAVQAAAMQMTAAIQHGAANTAKDAQATARQAGINAQATIESLQKQLGLQQESRGRLRRIGDRIKDYTDRLAQSIAKVAKDFYQAHVTVHEYATGSVVEIKANQTADQMLQEAAVKQAVNYAMVQQKLNSPVFRQHLRQAIAMQVLKDPNIKGMLIKAYAADAQAQGLIAQYQGATPEQAYAAEQAAARQPESAAQIFQRLVKEAQQMPRATGPASFDMKAIPAPVKAGAVAVGVMLVAAMFTRP